MNTTEEDLPALVEAIKRRTSNVNGHTVTLIRPTQTIYIGPLTAVDTKSFDGIVICHDRTDGSLQDEQNEKSTKTLELSCGSGKLGSRALRSQLPRVPPFVAALHTTSQAPKLLFSCSTGRDLSAGIALVVLCMYFDDDGTSIVRQGFIQIQGLNCSI